MRLRTCNCIEIGIKPEGILFELMKMHYPQLASPQVVEKCTHWEEVETPTILRDKEEVE